MHTAQQEHEQRRFGGRDQPPVQNDHFHLVYGQYPRITDMEQASYVRALGEAQAGACEHDRAVRYLTDTIAAALRDDPASRNSITDQVRQVATMYETLKTRAIGAMSARVYLSHHVNHLCSQIRHATATNSTIVSQLSQQRRNARDQALQNDELRNRIGELEATLTETQQHSVGLSTEVETLRKQCYDLGKSATSNSDTFERGQRFFSALLELVANYEAGTRACDAVMNRGISEPSAPETTNAAIERPPPPPPREPHQCSMCLSQPATVVARPCNHLMACSACTVKLAERQNLSITVSDLVSNQCADKFDYRTHVTCPRCRADVNNFLYVFI